MLCTIKKIKESVRKTTFGNSLSWNICQAMMMIQKRGQAKSSEQGANSTGYKSMTLVSSASFVKIR